MAKTAKRRTRNNYKNRGTKNRRGGMNSVRRGVFKAATRVSNSVLEEAAKRAIKSAINGGPVSTRTDRPGHENLRRAVATAAAAANRRQRRLHENPY
jgi:hypothetical protein